MNIRYAAPSLGLALALGAPLALAQGSDEILFDDEQPSDIQSVDQVTAESNDPGTATRARQAAEAGATEQRNWLVQNVDQLESRLTYLEQQLTYLTQLVQQQRAQIDDYAETTRQALAAAQAAPRQQPQQQQAPAPTPQPTQSSGNGAAPTSSTGGSGSDVPDNNAETGVPAAAPAE